MIHSYAPCTLQDNDDEDDDRWVHEQIRKGVGGIASTLPGTSAHRQQNTAIAGPQGTARRPLTPTSAPAQQTAAIAGQGEAVLASLMQGLQRLQVNDPTLPKYGCHHCCLRWQQGTTASKFRAALEQSHTCTVCACPESLMCHISIA